MIEGVVIIDYNSFYLKNFVQVLFTSPLQLLTSDLYSVKSVPPICYCFNNHIQNKNTLGSFSLVSASDGKTYAESNFHVLASEPDLKRISANLTSKALYNKEVTFQVGSQSFNGEIVEFELGDAGSRKDYCKAVILDDAQALKNIYDSTVDNKWIEDVKDGEMKMFGATTKKIRYTNSPESTRCEIEYGRILLEFYLYKIDYLSPSNPTYGDSGSKVLYRRYKEDKELTSAMLVAKSDRYAYMYNL